MRTAVAIESLLMIGLGVLGAWEGIRLSQLTLLSPEPLGPGWYLFGISVPLGVCGLVHLQKHVRNRVGARKEALRGSAPSAFVIEIGRFSVHLGRTLQGWLILAMYDVVFPIVGFSVSTSVFLIVTLRLFGVRTWLRSALLAVALTLLLRFVFMQLGGIQLPRP